MEEYVINKANIKKVVTLIDNRNGTEYKSDNLPDYRKHDFIEAGSHYGYIILTNEVRVIYFFKEYTKEYGADYSEVGYYDVTKHFTIIE